MHGNEQHIVVECPYAPIFTFFFPEHMVSDHSHTHMDAYIWVGFIKRLDIERVHQYKEEAKLMTELHGNGVEISLQDSLH